VTSRQVVSVTRPLEPSWCCRPLQSLVGWHGSERTGCSHPVRPIRSRRTARPVFPSPPAPGDATHRVLLSWGSIPSTAFPEIPVRDLSASYHSHGVLSPTAHGVARVHGLTGCPARRPRLSPRYFTDGPTRRLRCRSQVFSTSQRLFPLATGPPFSGGWRSWGSTLQGFDPSAKPHPFVTDGVPS